MDINNIVEGSRSNNKSWISTVFGSRETRRQRAYIKFQLTQLRLMHAMPSEISLKPKPYMMTNSAAFSTLLEFVTAKQKEYTTTSALA